MCCVYSIPVYMPIVSPRMYLQLHLQQPGVQDLGDIQNLQQIVLLHVMFLATPGLDRVATYNTMNPSVLNQFVVLIMHYT